MNYYFGNHNEQFSDYIDERFPDPLLDELEIHVFLYLNHEHNKVTDRSITGLF